MNHPVLPRKDLSSLPRIPKKSQVYVEVPPRPSTWKSQASLSQLPVNRESSLTTKGRSDSSHTTAGSTAQHRNSSTMGTTDGRMSPVKRTGGRDDRGALLKPLHFSFSDRFEAPFEKLESLIDEIFEAEDDLPQYPDPSDLRHDLFSLRLTTNYARPCLNPAVVSKITAIVGKISRPTKRRPPTSRGQNGAPNSARKDDGRISDLEVPKILRLLKTLERSVQTGEDLDPFKLPSESQSSAKRSISKKSGKGSKKGKASEPGPSGDGNPVVVDPEADGAQDSGVNLGNLLKCLAAAKESILAAECCVSILSSDRLPKQVRIHTMITGVNLTTLSQVYSEELISTCFSVVKNQLSKIVYPFVEAATDLYGQVSPILRTLAQTNSTETQEHRGLIAEIFQVLSSVIPRINSLICAEFISLSDVIIIQAVYIAIGPFFVMEPTAPDSKGKKSSVVHNTLGNSAMKGLRLDALTLIRSVGFNYSLLALTKKL
jgi:cohesin loading factor subunit SCC2